MNDETKGVIKLCLVALAIVVIIMTISIVLVRCISVTERGF